MRGGEWVEHVIVTLRSTSITIGRRGGCGDSWMNFSPAARRCASAWLPSSELRLCRGGNRLAALLDRPRTRRRRLTGLQAGWHGRSRPHWCARPGRPSPSSPSCRSTCGQCKELLSAEHSTRLTRHHGQESELARGADDRLPRHEPARPRRLRAVILPNRDRSSTAYSTWRWRGRPSGHARSSAWAQLVRGEVAGGSDQPCWHLCCFSPGLSLPGARHCQDRDRQEQNPLRQPEQWLRPADRQCDDQEGDCVRAEVRGHEPRHQSGC